MEGDSNQNVSCVCVYIYTCMRMSKDTFSDKRLRKHSSVCTDSKLEKKVGKTDVHCSQPCSERFLFAVVC